VISSKVNRLAEAILVKVCGVEEPVCGASSRSQRLIKIDRLPELVFDRKAKSTGVSHRPHLRQVDRNFVILRQCTSGRKGRTSGVPLGNVGGGVLVLLALKYEAVRKVGDPTWWIL
jgi:hypothetical protein